MDEHVLSMIKYIFEVQQVMSIRIAIGFDQSQHLNFVHRLIEEIFVIGDHFQAAVLPVWGKKILDFKNFSEGTASQNGFQLESAGQYIAFIEFGFCLFFEASLFPLINNLDPHQVVDHSIILQRIQLVIRRGKDNFVREPFTIFSFLLKSFGLSTVPPDRTFRIIIPISYLRAALHQLSLSIDIKMVTHVVIINILVL